MSFKVKKTSTGHMGITLSFIKQLKSKERIMKKLLTLKIYLFPTQKYKKEDLYYKY